MVNYLCLTAELSNVTELAPLDSSRDPFEYTFKLQCVNCRETHDKAVTINLYEKSDLPGSRGETSFQYKCSYCSSHSNIDIRLPKGFKGYSIDDNGKKVKILEIDSRGCSVQEFIPDGFFKCVGAESGTKFNEVEFDDGEWYDYDDDAGAEVSITDVKWEILKK